MARGRSEPVNRHWTGFATAGAPFLAFTVGTAGATILPAAYDRETILRTRGNLVAAIDTAGVVGQNAMISVGLILVPEGTGSTVLWSPFTDSDAPWFFYSIFNLGYEEMVTDVIDVPGLTSYRETVDSKGMRRVRNQEVQMVVENTTIGTAAAVNVSLAGRFLTQE